MMAIFTVAGTLAFNLGISLANLSIVAAISSSGPLVSTIYSRIVYKEKLKLSQYLGGILIVLGIVFVSVL
jgi:drug/metabolite transporter (DMT)-like permease